MLTGLAQDCQGYAWFEAEVSFSFGKGGVLLIINETFTNISIFFRFQLIE
jgi:hypothetical protein